MIGNLKQLAGAAAILMGATFGGSVAHGQNLGYDAQQYRRDEWQTRRDYNQLNRDLVTGNPWGLQRDLGNLQQDRRDLYQDRRNIRQDVRYLTPPYSPGFGTYPLPSYPPAYGTFPPANPYGGSPYGGGYAPARVYSPW
jgi:hypothetical protein